MSKTFMNYVLYYCTQPHLTSWVGEGPPDRPHPLSACARVERWFPHSENRFIAPSVMRLMPGQGKGLWTVHTRSSECVQVGDVFQAQKVAIMPAPHITSSHHIPYFVWLLNLELLYYNCSMPQLYTTLFNHYLLLATSPYVYFHLFAFRLSFIVFSYFQIIFLFFIYSIITISFFICVLIYMICFSFPNTVLLISCGISMNLLSIDKGRITWRLWERPRAGVAPVEGCLTHGY